MIKGTAPVKLICGEAYQYRLRFSEDTAKYISSVCISSKELGFCHSLEKNDNGEWVHLFTGEETKLFKSPITTTYSVTIHNTQPELEPQILANQVFTVVMNKDKECC